MVFNVVSYKEVEISKYKMHDTIITTIEIDLKLVQL